MKRTILILTVVALVALPSVASAQLFRACPSGSCRVAAYSYGAAYSSTRVATTARSYGVAVAPCAPVMEETTAPRPCAPCAALPKPCAPVAEDFGESSERDNVPAPCAPCASCECVGGECGANECAEIDATALECARGACRIRTASSVAVATSVNSLLASVNAVRRRYGLAALRINAALQKGAARQAAFCSQTGALIHASGVAEILAQNGAGIDAALNQWLASPAHKAILLNGAYSSAGVAVVVDSSGRSWCCVQFR